MLTDSARQPISPSTFGDTALRIGQWCAVGALLAVPINKPATSILLALSLLFSLLGRDARERWSASWRNPVAKGFLVWGVVLLASSLLTPAPSIWPGSFVLVCGYPLLLGSVLRDETWGRRALTAFAIAVTFTMLVSFGMEAGLVPQRAVVAWAHNMRNTVFKEYTQQGLSVLILGCMAMACALTERSNRRRWPLLAIATLATANVALVLGSRTAHIALIPLVSFWAWRFSARYASRVRALLAALSVLVLISLAFLSPVMKDRVVHSLPDEASRYVEGNAPTATGIRMHLWRRTLEIIGDAPVFGHGFDQWRPAYRSTMQAHGDSEAFVAGHPHQEFLLILAEQGVVGLMVYLALLAALVRHVWKLAQPWRDLYGCVIAIYLVAGMANCLWGDFTHRHTFVLLIACIPALMRTTTKTRGSA